MRLMLLALDVDLRHTTGDSIHVRELAENLARLGNEVLLFVHAGTGDWTPPPSVRLCETGREREWETALKAAHLARTEAVDLIYERRFTPKVGAVVAALSGVRLAVEVNGLADRERAIVSGDDVAVSRGRMWLRSFLLRRARQVVAVSKPIKDALCADYGLLEDRVSVVPNGVNADLFTPLARDDARGRVGLPLGPRLIGFVGYLSPWQGVDIMIEVVSFLNDQHHSVEGVIVGDGPARSDLQELAHRLKVEDQVRFIGSVPYRLVPQWISAFDLAFSVKPPLLSGSPLKVREYMACAVPVVATAGSEYDFEIVSQARAGILVDHRKPQVIAMLVRDLLSNPDERHAMGLRGRAYVERNCTWLETARGVVNACRV